MKGTSWLWGVCALLATPAGCSDELPPEPEGYQPIAAALPMPPVLTPCATGWREVEAERAGDPSWCSPWPASGRATCTGAQAHFPGEPGCSDVGVACPAGEWPADLPAATPILYVSAAASPGGNGDLATPFDTIAAATAAATSGTVIALARGTYDEQVLLPGGVELRGACAAETAIATDAVVGPGIVEVLGADAALRNLRIGPGLRAGIVIDGAGRSATIDGVFVDRTTAAGIWLVDGASATATSILVRGTRGDPADGILVRPGASIDLTRASIEQSVAAGIHVLGELGDTRAPSATLEQVAIVGIAAGGPQMRGYGLDVDINASFDGQAIVVEDGEVRLIRFDNGSQATVRDLVVTGVPEAVVGVWTGRASTLTLERAYIDSGDAIISTMESLVTASDVIVAGQSGIFGAVCQTGALELERVQVSGRATAFQAELGCALEGADLTCRGAYAGVASRSGSTVTVARVLVDGGPGDGVFADGADFDGVDVTVRDLDGDEFGPVAVLSAYGGTLHVERVNIERVAGLGVGAFGEGDLTASEVSISNVTDNDCGGTPCDGYAIATVLDANLSVSNFRAVGSAVAGIMVGPGAEISLGTGFVDGSPIGVNSQEPNYGLDAFANVVFGGDTEVVLDTSSLPIPGRE